MPPLMREILRRCAHLPLVDAVAVKIEDILDLARIAGSSERRRATHRRIAACRTIHEWLAFIRPMLPYTQIDSEISQLLALAAERKVRRVLEIGTAQGGTTFLLGRAIPTAEMLATVDLLPRHRNVLRFLCEPKCATHVLRGSSAETKVQQRIAALLYGAPLDLLFLDGDHCYDGVRKDYHWYSQFVRPGGLIVFHDIVRAAESGSPTAGHRWVGGVPRFWHEIKSEVTRSWEFVENWNQQGFGIGVIEAGAPPPATMS